MGFPLGRPVFGPSFWRARLGPTFSLSQGPTFCRDNQVDLRFFSRTGGSLDSTTHFRVGNIQPGSMQFFGMPPPQFPWKMPMKLGLHYPEIDDPLVEVVHMGLVCCFLSFSWGGGFFSPETKLCSKKRGISAWVPWKPKKKPPRIFPLATQEDHPKFLVKNVIFFCEC